MLSKLPCAWTVWLAAGFNHLRIRPAPTSLPVHCVAGLPCHAKCEPVPGICAQLR